MAHQHCVKAKSSVCSYGGLREILRKALDFEPLPASLPLDDTSNPKANSPDQPRFARDVAAMLTHTEPDHAWN